MLFFKTILVLYLILSLLIGAVVFALSCDLFLTIVVIATWPVTLFKKQSDENENEFENEPKEKCCQIFPCR